MRNEKCLDPRCEELLDKIAELIRGQSPEKQKELLAKYTNNLKESCA